ncbi:hypothetical protein PSEUBRA_005620 [Kalmanozyma brasiliensis GHG001]|uniref:uncharacterized protein n=1 Tax=Kalmanozyma brasiliensis (strain GHG001) TaxID=1365824 RepID=UPI002867E59E|nr:uncharacterized protein PSEUBRA_005620 [Kalmanozyma brasiliensis GHG001]KAF6767537.1 hypothetical protein PSEUBRA_005620 [Kalmanozyma brasiliensis GHG001]
MASTLGRCVRRLRPAANSVASSSTGTTAYASRRNLSASVPRHDDEKPDRPGSDEPSSSSTSDSQPSSSNQASGSSTYKPSSRAGAWPFEHASSSSSDPTSSKQDASSSSSSSTFNPYKGLFDGSDPFPTVTVPNLSSAPAASPTAPTQASWLSDQLDSLTTSPRTPRPNARSDDRKKHPIPRSVLFADSDRARQSEDFRPRKPAAPRKRFDRTPLTQQEANAFMSLLNQALAGTSTPTSSPLPTAGEREETPFGSYTSLISNPKTQSGSKALLQAFATRNRLKRFEEAREQRARRFMREGLAGSMDPLVLEAGIDEAREAIAACENLVDLLDWAKREVWGIHPTPTSAEVDLANTLETSATSTEGKREVKYGKETPFYPSVLQLLFLTIRDRYRAPHVALTIPRTTRALGIESYVLGVTGSLYNEVLKTQWDWLGDLPGVVSTLRQARETGILSAPLKHPIAPEKGAGGLATSEDESIRETVDRIANEVRKYVLDQKNEEDVFGEGSVEAGKGGKMGGVKGWSEKWLLTQAEEATGLAGRPFRLTQKRMSRFDQREGRERGRVDGERRMTPRPFRRNDDGYQRESRSASSSPRFPSQYNPRSSWRSSELP